MVKFVPRLLTSFPALVILIFIVDDASCQTNDVNQTLFSYVTRSGWGARIPAFVERYWGAAPYVIVHHSYEPGHCTTNEQCIEAMKSMQIVHMDTNGWNDIGYSFAIGGDGQIYTGRGFHVIGAHAPGYNDKSVGICLIGDWQTTSPPQNMIDALEQLIAFGVQQGNIAPDYELMGHRQVRDTACPGNALFDQIIKFSHWSDAEPIYKPGYKSKKLEKKTTRD